MEALGRTLASTLIVLCATRAPEAIIAELNAGAMLSATGIADPTPVIEREPEEADGYLATIVSRGARPMTTS